MQETKINWTGLTWGAVSGCDVIAPECKFCYAKTLAENRRGTPAFPKGFDITMRPHKLGEPKKIKAPSLIFCNSTSDWFHDDIPDSYRDQMFAAIEETPRHRYQILTKRAKRARAYFRTRKVPRSVWLGVTVGHSSSRWLIDELRAIDAPVRFISAEPLLSALDLDLDGISWLISGGESGVHLSQPTHLKQRGLVRKGDLSKGEARWMLRDDRAPWLRELRDQCAAAGVAFWHKQHGGPRPESGGRILDGRTHDGMPDHVPDAMPAGYVHTPYASSGPSNRVQLPLVS